MALNLRAIFIVTVTHLLYLIGQKSLAKLLFRFVQLVKYNCCDVDNDMECIYVVYVFIRSESFNINLS